MTEINNKDMDNKNESNFIKWAWLIIFAASCLGTVIIKGESLSYALGLCGAAFIVGFALSPVAYVIMKIFTKIKWVWYHWFNAASTIGFTTVVLQWIVSQMVDNLNRPL